MLTTYLDYHGLQTFKGELDRIFSKKADLDANGKILPSQISGSFIPMPSTASNGQFLVYNGSAWVARTIENANGVSF